MTRTHAPNFVDLAAALADDASNQVVRDEDLLGLTTGRQLGSGRGAEGGSRSAVAEGLLEGSTAGRGRRARGTGRGPVRKVVGIAVLVFEEDCADVVNCDVDGVSNTGDGENTFGRAGKHGFASSKASSGGLLDFLDLGALLADDGAHARVGNDEADGDRLGAGDGRLIEGFVVDSSDDETESLKRRRRREEQMNVSMRSIRSQSPM